MALPSKEYSQRVLTESSSKLADLMAGANMTRMAAKEAANAWLAHSASYEDTRWRDDVLHVLMLPLLVFFVALFPPLLKRAEEAPHSSLWRLLRIPPRSRFWIYEMSCLCFTCILSFSNLPITRGEPDNGRDWLIVIWAVALFWAQGQFINAVGLQSYLYDPCALGESKRDRARFAATALVRALVHQVQPHRNHGHSARTRYEHAQRVQ
jgi:hypothetical protein